VASAPEEKLIERALALIVESESAPQDAAVAARLALSRWRARSAEHAAAAHEARRRWDALAGMAAQLRKLQE
jgi:ferric-dicitrate binding protein FerR (iron transport regulator)